MLLCFRIAKSTLLNSINELRSSVDSNNSNATNFDISREEFINDYNEALRDDKFSLLKTEQDNFFIDPAAVYEDDSEPEKVVHFKLPEQSCHPGCIEDDNRIKAVLIEGERSQQPSAVPAETLIYTILPVLYKNYSDNFRKKVIDFSKEVFVYPKQRLAELFAEMKAEPAASPVLEKSAYKRFEFEGSWLCVKLTLSYDIQSSKFNVVQALMLTKDLSLEKLLTGEQS